MGEGGEEVRPPVWDQTGQIQGAGLNDHRALQRICSQMPLLVDQGRGGGEGGQKARGPVQQCLGVGLAGGDRQHANREHPFDDLSTDLRILGGTRLQSLTELGQDCLGVLNVHCDALKECAGWEPFEERLGGLLEARDGRLRQGRVAGHHDQRGDRRGGELLGLTVTT